MDGQLDNTVTSPAGLTATKNGWAVGARYDGSWSYQGLIDDVRLFDRALTPTEVHKFYLQ
ncbi:MAG TPA: LamG-like jellyroll fold domain-containing protein [Candidatus Acidoferrales bacterium]|nr:LamG-like jellyroll fold domain-containing protein [Candidatus Acidoferrales bacterium]